MTDSNTGDMVVRNDPTTAEVLKAMTLPARLNELAHLKDANGVFIFPDTVRKKCRFCFSDGSKIVCGLCAGYGTVASQDMAGWVKAAIALGYRVGFLPAEGGHDYTLCNLYLPGEINSGYKHYGDDPFEALIAALEAANGKETG